MTREKKQSNNRGNYRFFLCVLKKESLNSTTNRIVPSSIHHVQILAWELKITIALLVWNIEEETFWVSKAWPNRVGTLMKAIQEKKSKILHVIFKQLPKRLKKSNDIVWRKNIYSYFCNRNTGKSCTTSSCWTPQGLTAARVNGWAVRCSKLTHLPV